MSLASRGNSSQLWETKGSCCAVLPLYRYEGELQDTENAVSGSGLLPGLPVVRFERLTIANLAPAGKIFWLHAVWTYLFVVYALWLIRMHYEVLPSSPEPC